MTGHKKTNSSGVSLIELVMVLCFMGIATAIYVGKRKSSVKSLPSNANDTLAATTDKPDFKNEEMRQTYNQLVQQFFYKCTNHSLQKFVNGCPVLESADFKKACTATLSELGGRCVSAAWPSFSKRAAPKSQLAWSKGVDRCFFVQLRDYVKAKGGQKGCEVVLAIADTDGDRPPLK